MKYEDFKTSVVEELKSFYGADATVEVTTSEKNNGVRLDGVIIRIGEANVAPIIYLQQYYDEFQENKDGSIGEIVGKIVELRERNELSNTDELVEQITDWSYVSEKIFPMIVSAEYNKDRLSQMVTRPFLDLAVILYVRLDDLPQVGEATVKITKQILDSLGVSEIEAFDKAIANMKNDGYRIQDIFSAITGMMDEDILLEENSDRMYVMTNDKKQFGAVGILDFDLLQSFGRNCFILPSSIHEIIIVPDDESADQGMLDSMVQEVNATQVSPEEVLSGHSYYYDFDKNEVRVNKIL